MNNHHPYIHTEAVLQYKHRNPAIPWSTPSLRIATVLADVLYLRSGDCVVLCHSAQE